MGRSPEVFVRPVTMTEGQRLQRIFESNAFQERRFGPARWIRGGAGFTTLEHSAATAGAERQGPNSTTAMATRRARRPKSPRAVEWSYRLKATRIIPVQPITAVPLISAGAPTSDPGSSGRKTSGDQQSPDTFRSARARCDELILQG